MNNTGPENKFETEVVHIARLALSGRLQDVSVYLSRLAKKLQGEHPDVAAQINTLLASPAAQEAPFRTAGESLTVPRDADSRLELIRAEFPALTDAEPIWDGQVKQLLNQIIAERAKQALLAEQGLTATRSALFTGQPGVGKSLAARWIAQQLGRPLITLDLSAVMSSFLGKTGSNVRHVLDYAKSINCVLFLDELDAVAKRRDDATEIGELKRLVTVLLQEIDDWPASGLLLAATNHPGLLDPAIWRRFEMIIEFPMPTPEQARQAVTASLRSRVSNLNLIEAVSIVLEGNSFSDIGRELSRLIKQSVMDNSSIDNALRDFIRSRMSNLKLDRRKTVASCFLEAGFTQRETHSWTGVHRDTLRKMEKVPD
jgi:SpoVK/Ycf46/Vps4 family AAA+-type ATPase